MTQAELLERIDELSAELMCSDNGCIMGNRRGAGTNGGCRCLVEFAGRRSGRMYVGRVRQLLMYYKQLANSVRE